jgi:late competence protein required for DNA uptake (superfamily II DNA/RNA helicase)
MNQLICARCGTAVEPEEAREHAGALLCEDCYLEAVSLVQTCDPWAVHTAKSLKDLPGGHALTPLQQKLYDLVKERGEVPILEAAAHLGLTEEQLRREIAPLRHMEKLRGCKKGDLIFLTLF